MDRFVLLATIFLLVSPAAQGVADCERLLVEADEIGALRNTDPASGIERARSGIARAQEAGCTGALAEMHAALGDNLNVIGERAEASNAFERALGVLEDAPRDARYAAILRRSAVPHAQSGQPERALDLLLESLAISEAADDRTGSARTASNIGTVLSQMQQYGRAREYFEHAHAIHLDEGDRFGLGSVAVNLGTLMMRQADRAIRRGEDEAGRRQRERALEYNLEALDHFESLDNLRGIAAAASNAGAVTLQLGRPDEALPLLHRALEIAHDSGIALNELTSTLHIANALVELERAEEAVPYMERAWEVVAASTLANQAGVADARVRLERARGDLAAALEWQQEAGRIRDRMMEADLEARVAEIETRYESERQRRQIDELQHEQALSALELERERQLRYAAFAIVVLLLALGAAMYARYRLKVSTQHALEKAAREDPLTGLANRRHMRELIDYEVARTRRSATPFSLAVVDIDDFKRINDEHGHATGDEVLVGIAERINGLLRRQDTLARWGGDEMLLLLPETGEDGAVCLGRKLIELFGREPVRAAGADFDIALTVGVSQYWPGMDLDDCLKQADEAMYAGKRAGKRQVVRGSRK